MRVFLDMDGVLCDYYGGVLRAFGYADPWPYKCRPGEWNFFAGEPLHLSDGLVAPVMDRAFYAGLDWLPDGPALVAAAERLVGSDNVYLLSAPWDTAGCREGKSDWVAAHLPRYSRRLLIGSCKEACSFPGAVLVDDSEANCAKFEAAPPAPGRALLLPRPWNRRFAESSPATGAVRDAALASAELAALLAAPRSAA